MYLKYFVYVSSVNNLSDARYCSGMFVDYIGFDFDQNSKNKISIDNFKEILEFTFNFLSEKIINFESKKKQLNT